MPIGGYKLEENKEKWSWEKSRSGCSHHCGRQSGCEEGVGGHVHGDIIGNALHERPHLLGAAPCSGNALRARLMPLAP